MNQIVRLLFAFLTCNVVTVLGLECFYCQDPSQRIAPQLWLHTTDRCTKRRTAQCQGGSRACVVVQVRHALANFTVSGCSEDEFSGCEEYNVDAEYGQTNVQVCQCNRDRCNSDFHLDFGADLNRLEGGPGRNLPRLLGLGGSGEAPDAEPGHKSRSINAAPDQSVHQEETMPAESADCTERDECISRSGTGAEWPTQVLTALAAWTAMSRGC